MIQCASAVASVCAIGLAVGVGACRRAPAVGESGRIHGVVTYREQVALTADATVAVRVLVPRKPGAGSLEIEPGWSQLGADVERGSGQVPIAFDIAWPRVFAERGKPVTVRAEIVDGERRWSLPAALEVPPEGVDEALELVLVRAP